MIGTTRAPLAKVRSRLPPAVVQPRAGGSDASAIRGLRRVVFFVVRAAQQAVQTIVNRLLDPFTKALILRCASLSYDLYCLRRRALAQVRGAVLLAALSACSKSSEQERDKAKTAEKAECTSGT
ncbi:hypothetical protein CH06BL_16580 [Chromobacterium haemolyticum]|nr:hypothetical protein CH06BL_16580 [Chromobacterium haemolyticum]